MGQTSLTRPEGLPESDPGLSLTPSALKHLQHLLEHKTYVGIRVAVKKAGCSGYEYVLEYAEPEGSTPFDFIFVYDQIEVMIDKETYLKFFTGGTLMDYRKEGLNEGIKFDNPNVGHQCGCGESFTLAHDES